MPVFVLNDQTVKNSYGFKILTEGIDLKRFENNPVMLDSHSNKNADVIGKWVYIQKMDGQLLATPEFDEKDPKSKIIADKVNDGYIKGASMGISFNKKNLSLKNGEVVLSKCELLESSIVAIPSNAKAIRLYVDGTEIKDTEIQELCLSIQNEKQKPKNKPQKTMKQLSAQVLVILGLTAINEELTADQINEAVLKLSADKEVLEAKVKVFEDKEAATQLAAQTKLVDDAVASGKITADKKSVFLALAQSNYKLCEETLSALPSKKNYGKDVKTPTDNSEVKDMETFQKLSVAEQLAFKNDQPEAYKKLIS